MSTQFVLFEKDGIRLEASEESARLSIDTSFQVSEADIAAGLEDYQVGDWLIDGGIPAIITKADLKAIIDRLQEIYDMDTLF